MGDFHGVSEKFSVSLLTEDGSDRIRCEIGLNGLIISTPDGYRVLRKYPLNHIARWALRGSTLVLYTKSPGDVEELTLTLQGDQRTITSILDTLTCSCMQMVELLQSKESTQDTTEVTNSLTLLLNGDNKTKKSQLPLVDEVEFWRDPEKQGWMQSQGEVVKTWRRRWFILKQGFLFRFSSPDVSSATKARGVVDLSKVTDVSEARDQTSKFNSLKLSTESGYVAYVCDSETELVEWISALEGAVSAIVRKIAGVEHEPAPAPAPKAAIPRDDWSRQLEKVYSSAGSGSGSRGNSSSRPAPSNPMVKIVGYDSPAQPSSYSSYKSQDNGRYGRQQPARSDYNEYAGSLNQGNIAGIAGVARDPSPANPGSTYTDSFTRSEYPAYPVLAPTGTSYPGQNYPSGPAAGNQGYTMQRYGSGVDHYPSKAPQYQPTQEQRPYGQQGYGNEKPYPMQPQQPQPQQQPQQAPSSWQVHYTDEGRAYYHNSMTGHTQWELPAGGV